MATENLNDAPPPYSQSGASVTYAVTTSGSAEGQFHMHALPLHAGTRIL